MSLMRNILEMVNGKFHFYLYVGNSPAVEIILRNREIIADIKNPLLAMELGLKQLGKGPSLNSYILKQVKSAGFKVKVKYKMFELEI